MLVKGEFISLGMLFSMKTSSPSRNYTLMLEPDFEKRFSFYLMILKSFFRGQIGF
jgi:hypothetical protein